MKTLCSREKEIERKRARHFFDKARSKLVFVGQEHALGDGPLLRDWQTVWRASAGETDIRRKCPPRLVYNGNQGNGTSQP